MKSYIHQTREELLDTPSHQREHTLRDTGPWRAVFFDGPHPDVNRDGDEIPVWQVYIGDQDAEPTATFYNVHSFKTAATLAQRMASDRRLELINEASPA